MRRSLVPVLVVSTAVAGTAVATAAGSSSKRYLRYGFAAQVREPSTASQYSLRGRITFPESWRTSWRRTSLVQRLGPIGSCRITVQLRSRVVRGDDEPALDRVRRTVVGRGRYLLDEGTRANAAFRVARVRGRDVVDAALMKPAPNVRRQPEGGRLWIEVRARGTADPRTECHSGGPRSVGHELGNALASAAVGGFQF